MLAVSAHPSSRALQAFDDTSAVAPRWALTGHTGAARAIACSDLWTVTCGGQETLLWMQREGGGFSNRVKLTHSEAPTHMAMSVDSSSAFHAMPSGVVTVCDLCTGTHTATVRVSDTIVNTVSASNSIPEVFATGSDDGKLKVFDLRLFRSHVATASRPDPLTVVAFTASGDLACGGTDGEVTLESFRKSLKPLFSVSVATDVISALLPAPDNDVITFISMDATLGNIDCSVYPQAERVFGLRRAAPNRSRQLLRCAVLPSASVVMPEADGVFCVDTQGNIQREANRHTAHVTVVSSHSVGLATGDENGTIVVG
jgi:WD40 repeat protein